MKKNYFISFFKSSKLIWILFFLLFAVQSKAQTSGITHVYDTICQGTSYTLPGGSVVTASGNYLDTLTDSHSNDSIIWTHLSVTSILYSNLTVTICAGNHYVLPDGDTTGISGIYIDTLTSFGGCDSVIYTNLTVLPQLVSVVNIYFCDTIPGTYTYIDTLIATNGCDSMVTTTVTFVAPITLSASQTGSTLNATSSVVNGMYNWAGPCIVSGATTATPVINCPGTYTVTVTDPVSGCTKTATVTVTMIGIHESTLLNNVDVFPNPSNGQLVFDGIEKLDVIEIFDVAGRRVFSIVAESSKQLIDLEGKEAGIYFYKIMAHNNSIMQQGKIILQ